jgi:transcriptional regulator with XRE-family HTH domain
MPNREAGNAERKPIRSYEQETANPEWERFGRRLASIRGSSSQPDMARSLGVSKTTYGRLERGVREIGGDVLARLAAMGWSPLWVLTGLGEQRLSSRHAVDTAVIVAGAPDDAGVQEAEARRSQAIKDFASGVRSAETTMSQPLSNDALTMAVQLAAEALDGRSLPPPDYAELIGLIYEGLVDGLPEAKILRFARIGARGAHGKSEDVGSEEDSKNAPTAGRREV